MGKKSVAKPSGLLAVVHTGTRDWDDEIVTAILEMIASGHSVRAACIEVDVHESTFRRWVVQDFQGLAAQYAHARALQAEAWADKIIELSEVVKLGTVKTVRDTTDGPMTEIVTKDMVERAKLQIDALKWLLAKLHPKQFGEHLPVQPPTTNKREIVLDPFHRRLKSEQPGELVPVNGNGTNGHSSNGHG